MPVEAVLSALKRECLAIHSEDMEMCRKISEYGLSLLHDGDGVLTHCNAGPLATSRYGTGQGPLFLAKERGMDIRVFADETRPLLQGARLTSFELYNAGVDVTLICDSMASIVMKNGWVQCCMVGCDRVSRQRRHSKQNRHQRRSHTCKALRHTLLRAGPYLHHRYELHHRGGHKYRAPGRGRDPEQILRGARGAARCQVLQPRLRCDGQFAYLRHYHGKAYAARPTPRALKGCSNKKEGAKAPSFAFTGYRPISSLTSLKHLTAKSRSSLVWPAEIWVRMRSLPLGTTG